MSLEKGITHGEEKRKPYYHSGRFDSTCRPGGSCPWCFSNRMHSTRVREEAARYQEEEIEYEDTENSG